MRDDVLSGGRLRKTAALAGGLSAASGTVLLLAWWAGRENAFSIIPGWPPVNANSAFLFIACGSALALLAPETPGRAAAGTARALALVAVLLSLATASEYALVRDLGIDQILDRTPAGAARYPGRPSPHTAAAFLLLGAALTTLDVRLRRNRPAPALAAAAGVIAIAALLGHLFNGETRYGGASVLPHNEMALLTAGVILLLSAGCLTARPDSGAVATFASPRAGGIAARRMLTGLFAMGPLVVLVAIGARMNLYSDAAAGAIIVFLGFFEAIAFVLRTAGHLNRLDEESSHVQRMRDEVIAMASHELRNPLTMSLVAVSQLGNEAESLSAQGREVLAILDRSVRRMSRLVEDFLTVEKLESGGAPLRLEKFEMGPLLAETIAAMAEAEGRVIVQAAEGLSLQGDRDRLTQVIINLVSNALKFSPAGARVEVDAASIDGHLRVSVKDRGPGIPLEFQSRIFQRYARAEKSKTAGSGLGLYISKMIVEKHGGRMGFNTSSEGTTFFFELPTSEP